MNLLLQHLLRRSGGGSTPVVAGDGTLTLDGFTALSLDDVTVFLTLLTL